MATTSSFRSTVVVGTREACCCALLTCVLVMVLSFARGVRRELVQAFPTHPVERRALARCPEGRRCQRRDSATKDAHPSDQRLSDFGIGRRDARHTRYHRLIDPRPLLCFHGGEGERHEPTRATDAAHYSRRRNRRCRSDHNLIYFHEVDGGGHFAAWEQPELFADEIG